MLKKFPYLIFENLKQKIPSKKWKIQKNRKFQKQNIDEKNLKIKNDFHDYSFFRLSKFKIFHFQKKNTRFLT